MKIRLLNSFLLACGTLFLISGCGGSGQQKDLTDLILQSEKAMAKHHEVKLPEIPKSEYTTYTSGKHESPFREGDVPILSESDGKQPQVTGAKYNLDFPIVELKFVGLMQKGNRLAAIIKTPDGQYYSAYVGDQLGRQGGRIDQILTEKIKIVNSVESESVPKVQYILFSGSGR